VKLSDTKAAYDYFSGKASDVARQLSFAGIAVIWVLRVGEKTGGIPFDRALMWPLVGFVLALALDIAHYAYASIAWGVFNRRKEKLFGANSAREFTAPAQINLPSLVLFWGKLAVVVASYVLLLGYLASRV